MTVDQEHSAAGDTLPWVVMKFGGTSVATADRWASILALARGHREQGMRVVVVVSALSGVTDCLKRLCAEPDRPQRERAVESIASRHRELADAMGIVLPDTTLVHLDALRRLVDELPAAGGEDLLYWHAAVQGTGELLSSSLGAAFLSAGGLPTQWIDSRTCLLVHAVPNQNARSRILSAGVAAATDLAWASSLAVASDCHIAPGFVARDEAGRCVLLGRGGSDTSAACIGAMLGAARVEIWTDVTGMFSANPRQVPNARLLKQLDYEEAQEIATTGAKVLHPRCLSPLRESRVPLWIKDTARPQLVGTEIGPRRSDSAPSVKAISSRKGITLVSMESVGMWQQVGFLADVFEAFKRHGLSVDLIGSAETNVTVSLDPTENLLDSDAVAELAGDLARVCRVKVIAPCAAITLVGRGMRSMMHRLSAVLAEFGQHRVHLISQSSNNLNLTFVIDEDVVDDLLPRLHQLLIRSGTLRSDDAELFGPSWQLLYGEDRPGRESAWWIARREDLLKLAAERTPRYVYHLSTMRARANDLTSIRSVDRWHYALKANSHPSAVLAMADAGFALECVSPAELALAAELAPHARRLFTPSFAARAELAAALQSDAMVTVDSLFPLVHWPQLFAGKDIALRVDLGRGIGHHDKVRTGGSASKFGLPTADLDQFLALACKANVRIGCLHAHLGSGVLEAGHWPEVYAQLAALAQGIEGVEAVNIGGGLGVPAHPGELALDLAQLERGLAEVKHAYPQFALWMEPGRYPVADAGVLLATVTQIKRKGNHNYLGLDAGMHNLLRPALYDAWHEIANLDRLQQDADTLYQVVGPICETGDVLGANRRLPQSHEGDVVLIAQTGAYGAVMASRYNLRAAADEVVME